MRRITLNASPAGEGPDSGQGVFGFPVLKIGMIMPQSRKPSRVFVVDDEPIIASTLEMILRSQGFDATSFTQPLEALRAASSDAPDLLISDVVMPLLSGIDLAIQIRECCPDCRVLLFSGQAATFDLLENARTHGHAFDLVTKPVHPSDLLRKIQEVTINAVPPTTSN
jgi:DNA-binding NtrC family response regulator